MINEEEYLTKKEFASKANVNVRTLTSLKASLLKENPDTRLITSKPKDSKDYFHQSLLKRFLSEENYNRELNEYKLKRLIDCLMDEKRPFIRQLFSYKWDYMGTVSHARNLSRDICYDLMSKLYEELEEKFGDKANIRLFFTTEPYTVRDGHHNHFVLRVDKFQVRDKVVKYIENFFAEDITEIEQYDKYQAGMFYICKKGLKGTDWDLRGKFTGL